MYMKFERCTSNRDQDKIHEDEKKEKEEKKKKKINTYNAQRNSNTYTLSKAYVGLDIIKHTCTMSCATKG